MVELVPWEEKKDAWDSLNWFDMPAGQRIAGYTKSRVISHKARSIFLQVCMHNSSNEERISTLYVGVNTKSIKQCKHDVVRIPAHFAGWAKYLVPTGRLRAGRDASLGIYCEVKTSGRVMSNVGRSVLGAVVGFAPGGKVKGFNMKIKVIGANCICRNHQVECSWVDSEGAWFCPQCNKTIVT